MKKRTSSAGDSRRKLVLFLSHSMYPSVCPCAFFQVLLGGGEHQLDSVELIHFTGAGIVVDGHDIGLRILFADLFDDALTYNVIG